MKNKLYQRSRIKPELFKKVLVNFSKDKTATETAKLTKLSVRSVNSIYLKLRQRIALELDSEWQQILSDNCESMKIVRRAVQRPCPQQEQKIVVLVLSQIEGEVHLEVVPDARKNDSQPSNYLKPLAINAQDKVAEQVWQYLDKRLAIFRGLSEDTFSLHIKETAFRFNHIDNLYQKLVLMLEREPL